MKLQIKRIDKTLPLPTYQTQGSVAFDLYSRVDIVIPPHKPVIVPSNLIIEVPAGHMLMLASRSSLPLKKGLTLANAVGIIDQDYHGDQDEIGIQLLNFTDMPVAISRGERVVQAIIVPILRVTSFIEKDQLGSASRGGFGSTG